MARTMGEGARRLGKPEGDSIARPRSETLAAEEPPASDGDMAAPPASSSSLSLFIFIVFFCFALLA
jgi:hypothetical protein